MAPPHPACQAQARPHGLHLLHFPPFQVGFIQIVFSFPPCQMPISIHSRRHFLLLLSLIQDVPCRPPRRQVPGSAARVLNGWMLLSERLVALPLAPQCSSLDARQQSPSTGREPVWACLLSSMFYARGIHGRHMMPPTPTDSLPSSFSPVCLSTLNKGADLGAEPGRIKEPLFS